MLSPSETPRKRFLKLKECPGGRDCAPFASTRMTAAYGSLLDSRFKFFLSGGRGRHGRRERNSYFQYFRQNAAANQLLPNPLESAPRSPGEDAGRSLAEMAHRDLDAALQLLAERAQYITGASGTAIALRRGEHNDMVCRAAAGSSAPDLGALLSMEHGLSGECVRTRQLLRCDDAERDPRVNREVCRELGIASVIVMPIVGDEQVLGIFELLSSKPRAFDERDLSALLRLSEMVETAVRHPFPAQTAPHIHEVVVAGSQPQLENVAERPKAAPRPEPLTVAAVSSDPCPVLPPPAVSAARNSAG